MAETPKPAESENNVIRFPLERIKRPTFEIGDNPDDSLSAWLDYQYDQLGPQAFTSGDLSIQQKRRVAVGKEYPDLYEGLNIDFHDRNKQFGSRSMLIATVIRDVIAAGTTEPVGHIQFRIIKNPSFSPISLVMERLNTDENGEILWIPLEDEQKNYEIELLLKSEEVQE